MFKSTFLLRILNFCEFDFVKSTTRAISGEKEKVNNFWTHLALYLKDETLSTV